MMGHLGTLGPASLCLSTSMLLFVAMSMSWPPFTEFWVSMKTIGTHMWMLKYINITFAVVWLLLNIGMGRNHSRANTQHNSMILIAILLLFTIIHFIVFNSFYNEKFISKNLYFGHKMVESFVYFGFTEENRSQSSHSNCPLAFGSFFFLLLASFLMEWN